MSKIIEGSLNGEGLKVAIVASRFNHFVTDRLIEGCLDSLVRHGCLDSDVTVVRVPGSFELPPVASRLSGSGDFDVIVALGAVVRGDTPHFDYVAGEAAKGLARVAMESKVPVVYGILTTETLEQAIERAGTKMGNRGADAAVTAIEMARLYQEAEFAGA